MDVKHHVYLLTSSVQDDFDDGSNVGRYQPCRDPVHHLSRAEQMAIPDHPLPLSMMLQSQGSRTSDGLALTQSQGTRTSDGLALTQSQGTRTSDGLALTQSLLSTTAVGWTGQDNTFCKCPRLVQTQPEGSPLQRLWGPTEDLDVFLPSVHSGGCRLGLHE